MPGKSFYIVRKLIYFCNFKKVTGFVLRPGRDDRIDNTRGNCMKKILSVITLTVLIASCGQDRKARVQGSFSGLSHDTVLLEMVTTQGRRIVDSTVTSHQGGDFRFRVEAARRKRPRILQPALRRQCDSADRDARRPDRTSTRCATWPGTTRSKAPSESQLLKQFNTQSRPTASRRSIRCRRLYAEYARGGGYRKAAEKPAGSVPARSIYRIKREHIAFIMARSLRRWPAVYALYQRLPDDPWLFNPQNNRSDLLPDRRGFVVGWRYPDASRVNGASTKRSNERKKVLEHGRPDIRTQVGERAELSGNRACRMCTARMQKLSSLKTEKQSSSVSGRPGIPAYRGAKRRNEGAVYKRFIKTEDWPSIRYRWTTRKADWVDGGAGSEAPVDQRVRSARHGRYRGHEL